MNRPLLAILALAACPLASGCSVLPARDPDSQSAVSRSTAAHHLSVARAEVDRGELEAAAERLVEVRELTGIAPDVRTETEALLRDVALRLFAIYEGEGYDSDDFEELYELELPRDLRATAGVLTAKHLFAEDHPVLAYRQIRSLDREMPTHPVRAQSGDLLATIGLWLIRNPDRYYFFFSYRRRGVEALEYLVLNYPLAPQCPEAYTELARYYEDTDDLDYAIDRYEDLIVYHPTHALAVDASARVPYLRMRRLERHDYDRGELELAASEIDRWLALYPDHELAASMRTLSLECQGRLAESDLVVARYYARIDVPFGARIHAERALAEATTAGRASAISEARAILAALPAAPAPVEGVELEAPEPAASTDTQGAPR